MIYFNTPINHSHAETTINIDFSELVSLKRIHVKYKNAILSPIDCFFFTHERTRRIVKYFPRYLITTAKHTNRISGKVHACLSYPLMWKSWLCWGLTSQSTIFQSCRDGAIASWVINQYFRGVKCLAQGHNTAEVGLEPRTSRSGVRHSTTEPPRSPNVEKKHICDKITFLYFTRDINTVQRK